MPRQIVPLDRVPKKKVKKARKLKEVIAPPIPLEEVAPPEAVIEEQEPPDEEAFALLKARLESVLGRMADLKAEAKDNTKRTQHEFYPLQDEAVDILREIHGITPDMNTSELKNTGFEGERAAGTLVQKFDEHIDFEGIKPHVKKEVWLSITDRLGNKAKLAAAIELGHISAELVKANTSYTPQSPFVLSRRIEPKKP